LPINTATASRVVSGSREFEPPRRLRDARLKPSTVFECTPGRGVNLFTDLFAVTRLAEGTVRGTD
jgi:hypothetical protein